MAKRVVLYLRSSKDRHDVSVESQRRELERFAHEEGDIIVSEFIDKVESAKTANRPAFQEMMSEVKSSQCRFEKIVCYDTSRFSRRQYDAQFYKHLLKKHNVELVFLKLPKTDPLMDSVLESLMEIFDEFHSQKSKMDGLRGMRENVVKGWRAGGRAPIGYRLCKTVVGTRDGEPISKSKLEPDPKMFDSVQKYLRMRIQGVSRVKAAEDAQLTIAKTSLIYLEESALTYAGQTVWNRHNETMDGKYIGGKRYRDREDWVIQRDTHVSMISEKDAEMLMSLREKERNSRKRKRISHYLLSGVLVCRCGNNMVGDSGFYRCQKRCGNRGVKKETIEAVVVEQLFGHIHTPEMLMKLKKHIEKEQKKTSTKDLTKEIQIETKRIEKQINELIDLVCQVQNKRSILDRIDTLEEERKLLLSRVSGTEDKAKEIIQSVSMDSMEKFFKEYQQSFEKGDVELRKGLLRNCIEKAELDGNVLRINPSYKNITGVNWRPQGDSNPCCRRERAVS